MEEHYEWLKPILGTERYKVLLDVRKRASNILNNNVLKHYTKHDIEHSDRIVQIIGKLLGIPDTTSQEYLLGSDELFILALAAILHDIGMQLPSEHGLVKDTLSVQDLEQIRLNHGHVSAQVIRRSVLSKDVHELGLTRAEINEYTPYIGQICENHQSSSEFNKDEVEKISSDKGEIIRLGMLTCMLRLSDELDCDHRRVDLQKLNDYAIPIQSKLHWYACQYVDCVVISNGYIEIHASWPSDLTPPEINYLGNMVLLKIKEEFTGVQSILWKNGIKLTLGEEVIKKKTDLTYAKPQLPPDVRAYIGTQIELEGPMRVSFSARYPEKSTGPEDDSDWMTYWKMIGNPFWDYPVSYGGQDLVVTEGLRQISSEVGSYLRGPHGELRLVVADRGKGKTTLFQYLEGKYSSEYKVKIVDVGDSVANIRNIVDLNYLIFGKIQEEINPSAKGFSNEKLIDDAKRVKKTLICIDSLDRLTESQDGLVKDFFTAAQNMLTKLKVNIVLIFSCNERWSRFIENNELSYISGRNQWKLNPFSIKDAKELLDKRLKSTGLSFKDVFDDNCLGALHTMSAGNPRKILQNADLLCKYAAQVKVKKIDIGFINNHYHREFESNFNDLIGGLSKSSPECDRAIKELFSFSLEMDRRNLIPSTGWECLIEIIDKDMPREKVSPPYYAPLKYVSEQYQSIDANRKVNEKFIPRKEIKSLFKQLKEKGFTARDFITFYSANPTIPTEDREDIMKVFRSGLLTGDDISYFNTARVLYDEVMNSKKPASILISKAWDSIENLMVAILVKKNILNPQLYETKKDEIYYQDRNGIKRYRPGTGKILEEHAKWSRDLLFDELKKEGRWLKGWNSLNWILNQRNNIVKGKTEYGSNFTEKELTICREHLQLVFSELFDIYR